MAEVDNLNTAAETIIPKVSSSEIGAAELGTSPAQERSSNSHPHDSEYDTASDLEGGDEYEDEDADGESISGDDDEDDEVEEEDDDDDNEKPKLDDDAALEKSEDLQKKDDLQKKVDEDRSNPQYIPKRGTFYEHDDRTAGEAEVTADESIDPPELKEAGETNPQSPTAISHASKTMKKWQPASAVDRWSHDRFDPAEQAPKSRSELVNSYGYDIRNEDAPPRARRRRRYGRGPSKYSRNWEDETAYLKASNTPRKPPKLSDFPPLNERGDQRKTHNVKDEKENHVLKRLNAAADGKPNNSGHSQRSRSNEKRDRENVHWGNKNKSYGRNQQPSAHQSAMEFSNKQRGAQPQIGGISQNYHVEQQQHNSKRSTSRSQPPEMKEVMRKTNRNFPSSKHVQSSPNEHYNSNQEQIYVQMDQVPNLPTQNTRSVAKTAPVSNLSARLQQVQNRNDPSHVGSVQMHALANQNQITVSQQQSNIMIAQQHHQQQIPISNPANHSDQGRPKRYSSIRRSQHDAPNLDQNQLQQLHLQQQVAPQPLLLQDQMLQANLMQLYHQENLQAQMQALQVSAGQQPGPQQPQPYASVAPSAQQQQLPSTQSYATNAVVGPAPTGFYVAAADPYTANAAATQIPVTAQYAPPPPPNYMQSTAVSAPPPPLSYTSPPPQQTVGANTVAVPSAVSIPYSGPNPVPNVSPAVPNPPVTSVGQPGYQNYNYQNYNTVGGTTYFVPPAQTTSRPVTLPQRRPTNAIPILPPSEKHNQRNQDSKEEAAAKNSNAGAATSIGSVENLDHLIDNMFVQRPVYQIPAASQPRKISPSPSEGAVGSAAGKSSAGSPPKQSACSTSRNEETEKQIIVDPTESVNNIDIAKEVV